MANEKRSWEQTLELWDKRLFGWFADGPWWLKAAIMTGLFFFCGWFFY